MNRIRRTRVEDYLVAIADLCQLRGVERVSTGQIAQHLGVAGGTASSMIKQLATGGLVDHLPYAGASLTEKGRQQAQCALRRRSLLEMFLTRTLNLSQELASAEAWLLEPAASERLIDRLDQFLHPAVDA
jgi:DtxR family Mn-dependent transcriptional regulator